jgi:hypothetical protein
LRGDVGAAASTIDETRRGRNSRDHRDHDGGSGRTAEDAPATAHADGSAHHPFVHASGGWCRVGPGPHGLADPGFDVYHWPSPE